MQRSNSWISSLALTVGRAIGVVDNGPILPVWTPPPSPTSGTTEAFCRAEEMIRARLEAGAGAGRMEADTGARWVNVIETGTAPRSVFIPVARCARVH
jgi:hypothetical protein